VRNIFVSPPYFAQKIWKSSTQRNLLRTFGGAGFASANALAAAEGQCISANGQRSVATVQKKGGSNGSYHRSSFESGQCHAAPERPTRYIGAACRVSLQPRLSQPAVAPRRAK